MAPVSRADHMESGDAAVRDICTVLRPLATTLGKSRPAQLRLWDPYYCQGSVKDTYARNGFPLCHNEPEDFYAVIKGDELPAHDVLVSNPPFSGQHIQRAMDFCVRHSTPWALLLPTHVLERPWWSGVATRLRKVGKVAPVFVAPARERYSFDNCYTKDEAAGAATDSNTTKTTVAPLETIWIIGGLTPAMGAVLRLNFNSAGGARECVLAHSLDELPRRIRKVHVYAQRRAATKNEKKQRKQNGATTTARTAGIAPTNATAAREKAEREAREGPDWVCVCGNINFGRRDSCNRCPVTRADAAAAAPSGRVQSGTDTGSKKSSKKKKKKKKKKRQKVHA